MVFTYPHLKQCNAKTTNSVVMLWHVSTQRADSAPAGVLSHDLINNKSIDQDNIGSIVIQTLSLNKSDF